MRSLRTSAVSYRASTSSASVSCCTTMPTKHYCLLSRIGSPNVEPRVFEVAVRSDDHPLGASLVERVREVAWSEFQGITDVWREAMQGALQVW